MFSIGRLLYLALKKVWMIKFPSTHETIPLPPVKFIVLAFTVSSPYNNFLFFHLMKRVRIRSYSSPHFSRIFPHLDWIRRDQYLSIFNPNAGKCRKNADQNNFKYRLFLFSVSFYPFSSAILKTLDDLIKYIWLNNVLSIPLNMSLSKNLLCDVSKLHADNKH